MNKSRAKEELPQRRVFSEEFKKNKVKDLLEKQITVIQLSRLYGVSRAAVYKWLYLYSPNYQQKTTLVVQMESEAYKTQRLQEKLAELERIIGQKQLEIDFLNKLLEIGSEEIGYDLKKNLSTKLSNGIGTEKVNTTIK